MSSATVSIKLSDMISAARTGRLHDVVERDQELGRLARILLQPTHHHAALVGHPGTGKSSLLGALALRLSTGQFRPLQAKMYQLNTAPLQTLLAGGENLRGCLAALSQAAGRLENAIIVVEDIQLLAADDSGRLEQTLSILQTLATGPTTRLIVTCSSSAYHRLFRDDYVFARTFAGLELAAPNPATAALMAGLAVPRLERDNRTTIEPAAISQAVELGARFGRGRGLPDAAIRLLEETCVMISLDGGDRVTPAAVNAVIAEREHLPARDLDAGNDDRLSRLEPALAHAVVGQTPAVRTIARHLIRAQLGLGDATKPRGSFLLLGPSGVGKTETAKSLARLVFDNPAAIVRLDMSEYGEPHSAIRLIGSPPGYVGYEEGGQLTGAVNREPYSLILLDEIEKAHPKVFDLFLQLLDDGRLTDSSGTTVDFTETLVLATSNSGATEIAAAAAAGHDIHSPQFMQAILMPVLLRSYRPEFINRFDAILVFNPLTLTALVALAQRELSRLEQRLAKVGVKFAVPDTTLAALLQPGYNPLFGARPVKRLVTNHFETPIADQLIHRRLTGPITITGTEPWLQTEGTA